MINNFYNKLLKRKEVTVQLTDSKNPGYASSTKHIAESMKVSEDLVSVKSVKSKFGSNSFFVDAFVYDSIDEKNKTEPKVKVRVKKEGQ